MIGDDLAGVGGGIGAVDGGIAQGVPGILGIHIEGPFLNPARRGIHAEAKLRQLEDGLVDLLTAPQRGETLVTLAPECATPAQVARLVDDGMIVASGHSVADYETLRGAIAAGLTRPEERGVGKEGGRPL